MTQETGMTTNEGDAVSLKSVGIEATLNGLLLTATTRQLYQNKRRKSVEVVYTFPLPAHAVILGVDMTIGGKKLSAVVMEKSKAEEDYEEAIQQGDLPVMVERSGPGLYTANLGNLKRGEEVSIEVRWAQLLSLRGQALRVAIPTVIGKRYGDAHAQGGLAAHQSDAASPLAEYPLTLCLTVQGDVANATLACPTHEAELSSTDSPAGKTQTVTIRSKAYLDRDVVVNLSDILARQFGLCESNADGGATALVSFCPTLPAMESPLALKILVDCSGSMEGDSIEQAKEAVHHVLQQLREDDFVSYSRFGDEVAHNFSRPLHGASKRSSIQEDMLPAVSKKLANIGRLIRSTKANMGGTEMQPALISTMRDLVLPEECQRENVVPSLLLITDGNIWGYEDVLRAARASGHRIFAIGVGSTPVESLLRELAETTGGACEFITPNESMTAVALRMVARMRSAQTAQIHMDWLQPPTWQSTPPKTVFDGETIHAFATLATPVNASPAITVGSGTHAYRCAAFPMLANQAKATAAMRHGQIARLAAAQRLLSEDRQEALATAMEFGLVSAQTNLLLVHLRQEAEKSQGLPELEHIRQMMAAGHSGYGTARNTILHCKSVRPRAFFNVEPSVAFSRRLDSPTVWRAPKVSRAAARDLLADSGMDRLDIPGFLRKQAQADDLEETSPETVIARFNQLARRHTNCEDALDELLSGLTGEVTLRVVEFGQNDDIDYARALVLLLMWIDARLKHKGCALERHALRLLRSFSDPLTPQEELSGFALLDQELSKATPTDWCAGHLLTA